MAIGIALVGSGIFAKEEHLPAIQANPALALKAVYSRSLASAKSLSSDLDSFDLYSDDNEGAGYDELLRRDDIKGVVIALPIPVQPTYIKRALAAGKHVLAEKPVAKDIATATELISWAKSNAPDVIFSIAENFRFIGTYNYGSEVISSLGRVLQFRTRVSSLVQPGGKYYETAWRKTPSYQGGFLLDGGVHFAAATRLLLGEANRPVSTSAFTKQLQEHLPPVDTVDAIVLLKSGVAGTFSVSFGTTFTGSEYAVACEGGTVTVTRGKVTVVKGGKEEVKEFKDDGNGVLREIQAWGVALESGKADPRQSPEEALKDLEMIEAMLQSGEKNGASVELKC